eukprot:scaffold529685_cov48-Prasinocladus_malaysianus.AAC.1
MYDKLMKELAAKREQLSELILQQGSPRKSKHHSEQSLFDESPVYQASKPSHVKHLGGDLYSKMTPDELDSELKKLRAEIAELEQRTASVF